ncbi:hypothetical protein CGRA01v4_08083 [Colletotrichum graminicola]|nr:hypothetical protein CGRA01v4_08083 [Colletotrichum graminicola]
MMRLGRLDLTLGDRGCGSVYSPRRSSWLSSSIFRRIRPCRSRLAVRLGAVSDGSHCWVLGGRRCYRLVIDAAGIGAQWFSRRLPSPVQCERGSEARGPGSGPASAYRMSGDTGACRAVVTNGFLGSIEIVVFGFALTYIVVFLVSLYISVIPRGRGHELYWAGVWILEG